MAPSGSRWSHSREPIIVPENNLDPDDGNSTLCAACRLPIFSTPIITVDTVMMHDQCANHHLFPEKLEAHPLHPGEDLILHQQHSTSLTNNKCSRCGSMCGTSFYKCPPGDYDPGQNYDGCDFQLDLVCALPINWILHRSHPHRLMVIKGNSLTSFTCGVCKTQHDHDHQQPPAAAEASWEWQVYYVCIPCDFWIHSYCAILPNAIQIIDGDDKHRHPHPLLLKYRNPYAVFENRCAICNRWCDLYPYEGLGVYECFHCHYSAHIKCALYSDHVSFKPVLIRDAQVPGLLRLPFPNETTSMMSYILTKATDGTNTNGRGGDHQMIIDDGGKLLLLFKEDKIHEHPLTLHDHHDPSTSAAGGVAHRICNACVQIISPSDPFYSCSTNFKMINNELGGAAASGCGDFYLHECCAHLPTTLSTRQMSHNDQYHHLTLHSKPDLPGQPFNMFNCNGCGRQCNGFAYACGNCDDCMDVVCAFMHTSITYDAHANSHILRPLTRWDFSGTYNCCGHPINSWSESEIGYICNSCRNLIIHAKCALLPDTVTHKFDRHPLKLITTSQTLNTDDDHHQLVRGEKMFCEICENDIEDTRTFWYYGCKECEQYFHTACIPCLDRLSKIKFGFTIRVPFHGCPLFAVRALSVEGYRCQCGTCERIIITESDEIAFECSECYFRIRRECAAREINGICQL